MNAVRCSVCKIRITALCVIAALLITFPVSAAEKRTVTIAYIDYNNFIVKSKDGMVSGYAAEYLKRIASYTGWNYKFVDMDWLTAYEAVKNGGVDFYCVAKMTETRETDFDFSLYPICNEEMNIYTLPESDIYYEDFEALNGARIGILKNSVETDYLNDYAKKHNFTFKLVEYAQNGLAVKALDAGEVDAVALVNYSVNEHYKIVGNFGVSPAYLMSRNGSPYMKEFSKAQERLYFDDPSFVQRLEKKYYKQSMSSYQPTLTRQEAEYIAGSKSLTVAVADDMGPFEYYDQRVGAYRGITIDLYNKVSKLSGLKFDFVRREAPPALISQMEQGKIQLVGALVQNALVAQKLNLTQSKHFSVSTFSAVARDMAQLTSDSSVAVPAGYPMFADIARQEGYRNIEEYPSLDACVNAVATGKADLTYIISMCDSYLLNHARYAPLNTVALRETESPVCFGVSKRCSPLLLSVINKCISAVSGREINEMIVTNSVNAKPAQTFSDFYALYGGVVLLAVVVFLSGVIVLVIRNQKIAKQQLQLASARKQHHFLQRLYDTVPCGIFQYAYEPPHRILSCNGTCAAIYGYDEGQRPFVGQSPDASVKAGSIESFMEKFVLCEQSGKQITYNWPVTKRDGSKAIVECVMDIVETDNEKVFQEIFIDITERVTRERQIEKRYMSELNRNEKRAEGLIYTACFDIDKQLLVETDVDIPGVAAGISVDQFFDFIEPQLRGQHSSEELAELRAHLSIERTTASYDSGSFEYSFVVCRRKLGEYQWLRCDLTLLHNPKSGHLMCFAYVWDETDDHVSNIIIRNLALSSCDGFMSVDTATAHCLQYSIGSGGNLERTYAVYGKNDSIHRMCERMTIKDDEKLLEEIELSEVVRQLETEPNYQVFATLSDENGIRTDKALNYFYIDRQLGLAAVTVSDVTEVRRAEVLHAQLLNVALAAAEKADAAKGQFLSRVSHEMRTPLNAIIGFIDIAKGADAEKMANCLENSEAAAKQLLNVINDVLDMSSIESGKLKIANAPFDFKHVLASITNIYGSQCQQKGIQFEVKMKSVTEDWLVGDELRVNQILMNLLGNSVKFTSKGHIWLTVSQTAIAEKKIFIRFEVSDTGCGMSEEMKDRMFKPFEQESAVTAQKYGGSGLGLSIVKNLVTMMRGSIRVDSVQNAGTTFTIDLPFERSEFNKGTLISSNIEQFRVLAVDDEELEREYLGFVMSGMGVRYTCVADGDEAIAELERAERENDQYKLCLLDWCMPNVNGGDIAKRIRKKYGKEIVIIAIYAYDFQQTRKRAQDAGADVFLSKPIFPSSLFDLFISLTGGKIADSKEEPCLCDFTGRRVLLAEDNALNQIVAQEHLTKNNVMVDLAENGQVAVDMFTASAPGYYDAILMDIQMPVMDGFAAAKAIRASSHPNAKTIQIIAQTADAFNEDISKALSCGMNAHLAKPIRPKTLAKALADAFAKKGL